MATLCNPARPGRRKPGPPRRAHQAVPDVHPLPAALARRAVRHAWHADGHHPRDLPPRPARSPAPQGNPLRPRPGMSLHSALHSTLRERPGSHRCAPAGAWARDLSESDACLACATASLVRDQKELPRADAPASAKRSERAHRSASPRCWPLTHRAERSYAAAGRSPHVCSPAYCAGGRSRAARRLHNRCTSAEPHLDVHAKPVQRREALCKVRCRARRARGGFARARARR